MVQLTVDIPEELEAEFKRMSRIDLSILVSKVLKEELARIARVKKIVSKSKLKTSKAEALADKVSGSLAKRYDTLLKGL